MDHMIGEVTGEKKMSTKQGALYDLVIAGVQKAILKAKGIKIDESAAQKVIQLRTAPYRGLVKKIKKSLKQKWFPFFIEPIIMNEVLEKYYKENNPQRDLANSILKNALKVGLTKAAQEASLDTVQVLIPNVPKNSQFISEVKSKNSLSEPEKIYTKIVDNKDNYLIAKLKKVQADGVLIEALVIDKFPLKKILKSEISELNIKINFHPLSVFKNDSLKEIEGSIFA